MMLDISKLFMSMFALNPSFGEFLLSLLLLKCKKTDEMHFVISFHETGRLVLMLITCPSL
jgi:hypothetical protein